MPVKPAPLLLFVYNRLDVLKQTVSTLQSNFLAADTELFVFSDGPKKDSDTTKIDTVRAYVKSINGFKNLQVFEAPKNKGLARSIIEGVSQIIDLYGRVVVLEDDMLTSTNFLVFMNQCLETYDNKKNVFSISGFAPPIKSPRKYKADVYFSPRNSSNGWATWRDRWMQVDWNVSDYDAFISNKRKRAEFNKGGSDLSGMLKRQIEGKINSWSIRFCYQEYKAKAFTVYPVVSKIQNIGFGKDATHSNNYNRYHTVLDNGTKSEFSLPPEVSCDNKYLKEFRSFYSVEARAMGRVKTYLNRMGLLKSV